MHNTFLLPHMLIQTIGIKLYTFFTLHPEFKTTEKMT
jgi:hypothetical protein